LTTIEQLQNKTEEYNVLNEDLEFKETELREVREQMYLLKDEHSKELEDLNITIKTLNGKPALIFTDSLLAKKEELSSLEESQKSKIDSLSKENAELSKQNTAGIVELENKITDLNAQIYTVTDQKDEIDRERQKIELEREYLQSELK
jgi:predicted FMN-binding regulatory protein PaiB